MTEASRGEVVVANTTPIITAWIGGQIEHFPKIFTRLHVPVEEVLEWLAISARKVQGYPKLANLPLLADVVDQWGKSGFLHQHILPAEDRIRAEEANAELHHSPNTPDGLAFALVRRLFGSSEADAFLADDSSLRALAVRAHVPVVGSLFCLRRMCEFGVLSEQDAHQCMRDALAAGQRYTQRLIQEVFPTFEI